jgi:hypothetical protein
VHVLHACHIADREHLGMPGQRQVRLHAHAAGAVDVTVTNPDGQLAVLPLGFSFVAPAPPPPPPPPPPPVVAPAPVLAALSPATGLEAGGDVVSLTGTNFAAGVTVSLGGVAAPVAGTSSTLLTVVTPAQAVGVVDVTVTNPDGQSSTLAGAFTFAAPPPPPPPAPPPSAPAPVALTIAPVSGTTAGGDVVVQELMFGGQVCSLQIPYACHGCSFLLSACHWAPLSGYGISIRP